MLVSQKGRVSLVSITPVKTSLAFRSQAHLHGFAVVCVAWARARLNNSSRMPLVLSLCASLARLFCEVWEKPTRIDCFPSLESVRSSILSFRGNIANLLAQNPNNKGSARMGCSHVTPEPPPQFPEEMQDPWKSERLQLGHY